MIEATVREFFPVNPRDKLEPLLWQPREDTYITQTHAIDPAAANRGTAAAP
jgi:hypothetical protein